MRPGRHADLVQELLPHTPQPEIAASLHAIFLLGGGHPAVVSCLIEAGADINLQRPGRIRLFETMQCFQAVTLMPQHASRSQPTFSLLGLLFAYYAVRQRWAASTLSTYAYHQRGASPLMLSLITCSFRPAPAALWWLSPLKLKVLCVPTRSYRGSCN